MGSTFAPMPFVFPSLFGFTTPSPFTVAILPPQSCLRHVQGGSEASCNASASPCLRARYSEERSRRNLSHSLRAAPAFVCTILIREKATRGLLSEDAAIHLLEGVAIQPVSICTTFFQPCRGRNEHAHDCTPAQVGSNVLLLSLSRRSRSVANTLDRASRPRARGQVGSTVLFLSRFRRS